MWCLAVSVVLLLGAVGAEVVTFQNCPVPGKTVHSRRSLLAERQTVSRYKCKCNCTYTYNKNKAFAVPIFTNLTDAQERCVHEKQHVLLRYTEHSQTFVTAGWLLCSSLYNTRVADCIYYSLLLGLRL